MEGVSEESKTDLYDPVAFTEGNLRTKPLNQGASVLKSGKFGKVSMIEERRNSLPNFSSLFTHSYKIQKKIFSNQQVYLEGWLKKRSRYLKKWRKQVSINSRRWVVLTDKFLFTFKTQRSYRNPTQKLIIKKCEEPQCADQYLRKANSIRLFEGQNKRTFYFRADDPFEKHKFIEALKFILMISQGVLKLEEDQQF